MKIKKTKTYIKKQKGGLLWLCNKDDCITKNSNISQYYDEIYDKIGFFLQDVIKQDFNNVVANKDFLKKYECVNDNCLGYYKKNPDKPLLNMHKLLLSIKLTFCIDYTYNNFNYIILFLPLLDYFYKTNKINNNVKQHMNSFRDLYYKLKNKRNIRFKDIDYLLTILVSLYIKDNDTYSKYTNPFITFINTILDIFRYLLKNNKASSLVVSSSIFLALKKKLKEIIGIEKLDENIDEQIDKYLNIEKIKEIIGEEIFEELTLLIEDYDKCIKNNDQIDIRIYISSKINNFTSQFSFIDFGILSKLFNINDTYSSNTISGGSIASIKQSLKQSMKRAFTKNKYTAFDEKEEDNSNIFNNDNVNWDNFKSFLNSSDDNDSNETFFDVINNEKNDYNILNLILSSISINIDDNNDAQKIINYFNDYVYTPLYGKSCFILDKTEYENNTNKTQLLINNNNNSNSNSNSNSKKIKKSSIRKAFTYKNRNLSKKVISKIGKKLDIGIDDICIGLNQEPNDMTGFKGIDNFIGKIFSLNFKFIQNLSIVNKFIKKNITLMYLEFIMKYNIENYIKLKINEFILKLKDSDFLYRLNDYTSKYNHSIYEINFNKYSKSKDYEEYKEMIKIIQVLFSKIEDKNKLINYFVFYYIILIDLLNDFIKKKFAKIDDYNVNPGSNQYLLSEHEITKIIFSFLFRYTIPISSQFIESFTSTKIISGNNGYNYLEYMITKDKDIISNKTYLSRI